MTTAVSTLSASSMAEDLFKAPKITQSALPAGSVVVHDSANSDFDVAAPGAALCGGIAGVLVSAGTMTAGVFGNATVGDAVVVQKLGRAVCILAPNQTAVRGQPAVVANTSGQVRQLAPGERARGLVGVFNQSKTTTATAKQIEVDLAICDIAAPQSITAGAVGVVTAATVYATAPGQAKATAQVPLYRARFAGEIVRNLSVNLTTAPGGVDTVATTIQKSSDNGSTWSDLALTCTITGAAKSATDLSHSATLAAGDLLAIKYVSSAGTAADATTTFDVL